MELRHIVAATDESDVGAHAVLTAALLAQTAGARLTVLTAVLAPTVVPVGMLSGVRSLGSPELPTIRDLEHRFRALLEDRAPAVSVQYAVAFGFPAVEISRFAEEQSGNLIVLGRKPRSQATRILVGDTADAVARRSPVPCLFVPWGSASLSKILVALDGSARGLKVFHAACEFAASAKGEIQAVTVEAEVGGEGRTLGQALPLYRGAKLKQALNSFLLDQDGHCSAWLGKGQSPRLEVRRGEPVNEILAEVERTSADVLAVGYHRGGPPGVLEVGSVARRLAHRAACAVLTIPL